MGPVETVQTLLEDGDPGRALQVCADRLEQAGLRVDQRPDLGAIVARRGEGGVALSGHVDVVPPGKGWSHPPFGAEIEDGRLYGRGASDMRGPVACMVAAVEATDAPVTVVLTTDEETTMRAARTLSGSDLLTDAPLVVVGEPTGLDVATAGKGLVWLRLDVEGAAGHASTPRGPEGRGPSAAERLVELLSNLDAAPLRLEHPTLGPATAAITGIGTEDTPFNVLSGRGVARIDCRFPPPAMPEDVAQSVASKLQLPQDGIHLEVVKEEPSFLGDDELGDQAVEALREVDVRSSTTGVLYASEAGYWQRDAPTIICGPGDIDRAHAPDEYITVDELEAGTRAYRALLERFSPGP